MAEPTVSSSSAHMSRNLVASFLQNVVVLDDLAVMSQIHHGELDSPAGHLSIPDYQEFPSTRGDPIRSTQRGVHLNADAVIRAFADIGSVCAVLNPAPDDAFQESITRAAVRADIVVLDWKIHSSVGDTTLGVIRTILQDDQSYRRLRLIAIYTGEPNLARIAGRIQGMLDEFYDEDEMETDGPFRVSKGPVRIVVLAKEGVTNDYASERKAQEVAEVDLAERLVDEFALMNSGLLPSVALAGITSVRNSAHRILTRFNARLDAAYLGHRLLLPHPPDAEDQLVTALGSELLSVLEAHRPGLYTDIAAIRQWLSDKHQEEIDNREDPEREEESCQREETGWQGRGDTVDLGKPFCFAEGGNLIEGWSDLLLRGIDTDGVTLPTAGKNPLKKQSTEAFAPTSNAAIRSNQDFAALLSLRTRYTEQLPRLTLGTIVLDLSEEPYKCLLCLQPKCDSIRLKAVTGFPFLPLQSVSTTSTNVPFDLVVEVVSGQWEHLATDTRPSRLIVRQFSPLLGPSGEILPPGEILAEIGQSEEFLFSDSEGTRYKWISELKDEHALKVAGEVASALARPGPDDSEWLRRASRRPR